MNAEASSQAHPIGAKTLFIMWCQLCQVDETPNAPPELADLEIPQPGISALCCNHSSLIDRHNQTSQDDLGIEQKFVTKLWHMQVNMSLFGVCVVALDLKIHQTLWFASLQQTWMKKHPLGVDRFWEVQLPKSPVHQKTAVPHVAVALVSLPPNGPTHDGVPI